MRGACISQLGDTECMGIMNIEYLKEFLELSHCLNFTEAATNLHIHQSTLSKHISALEKEFDAVFLDRGKSGVSLTEQGFSFVGEATTIVEAYERARETLAQIASPDVIRLGYEPHDPAIVPLVSVSMILNNEAKQAPVHSRHFIAGNWLDRLANDDVDILIKTEALDTIEAYGFSYCLLMESPFAAIMEKDHPLAAKESLRVADLQNEVLIKLLNDNAEAGWSTIEAACRASGFAPKTRPILSQSFSEFFTMPLHGCVLLFPCYNREVKYLSKLPRYACRRFDDPLASFPVYCIFKEENRGKIAGFLDALDAALRVITEDKGLGEPA